MSAVFDTIDELRQASALHDAVVVACSFGKDSLIALDLCTKHFKRVEALHLVYVHGLELTAQRVEYVRQRWGVDTLVVDHPGSLEHRYRGYRCFADRSVTRKSLKQIYAEAKQTLGCTAVVNASLPPVSQFDWANEVMRKLTPFVVFRKQPTQEECEASFRVYQSIDIGLVTATLVSIGYDIWNSLLRSSRPEEEP